MSDAVRNRIRPLDVIVIVAVLLVLGSLMMPAVVSVGHVRREAGCEANLRALGLALLSYGKAHRVFPPGIIAGVPPENRKRDGWLFYDHSREIAEYVAKREQCDYPGMAQTSGLTLLLPYLGEKAAYDAYNFSLACCAMQNATAVSARINTFICPDNPLGFVSGVKWGYYQAPPGFSPIGPATTDYAFSLGAIGMITADSNTVYIPNWNGTMPGWPGVNRHATGPFNVNSRVMPTDKWPSPFKDGASVTFLMGEAVGSLPMGTRSDGFPPKGNERFDAASKTSLVETPWSQGFLGWRASSRGGKSLGNHAGFGSVFATTAWNAWWDARGNLAPADKWFPIPPNEGGGRIARPTWYRESSPDKPLNYLVTDGSGIPGDIGSVQGFRSSHATVPMLFADGSVRQIKPTIDPMIWVGLSTMQGREEIPENY